MTESTAVTWWRDVSLTALPTIGENIARLRRAAGYGRQGDFADLLGVPQSRVSDWENDRYELPDTATLLLIAKGLKCSIDELLEGFDPVYDLGWQGRDLESGRPQDVGGSLDVTAQARILELEQDNGKLTLALRKIENVASDLIQIAKAGATSDGTAKIRPGGGRRD